ncbi:MAG TPA: hypothetical protein VKD71_07570, partial [Gemmataceae bacterium]|nr:hypothetical protein [Gemmataceae bacterium]
PAVEVKEPCPECGSPMKLASARGRYFLGCTTWAKTKCKGTRPVSPELMKQIEDAQKRDGDQKKPDKGQDPV